MKMVKSLILGTAAGLVAMTGAQAADLPVKAKPVQYVKICSLYGAGFYYIPGTDTCIKVGGFVRAEVNYQCRRFVLADVRGTTSTLVARQRPYTGVPALASRLRHPFADRVRHPALVLRIAPTSTNSGSSGGIRRSATRRYRFDAYTRLGASRPSSSSPASPLGKTASFFDFDGLRLFEPDQLLGFDHRRRRCPGVRPTPRSSATVCRPRSRSEDAERSSYYVDAPATLAVMAARSHPGLRRQLARRPGLGFRLRSWAPCTRSMPARAVPLAPRLIDKLGLCGRRRLEVQPADARPWRQHHRPVYLRQGRDWLRRCGPTERLHSDHEGWQHHFMSVRCYDAVYVTMRLEP